MIYLDSWREVLILAALIVGGIINWGMVYLGYRQHWKWTKEDDLICGS